MTYRYQKNQKWQSKLQCLIIELNGLMMLIDEGFDKEQVAEYAFSFWAQRNEILGGNEKTIELLDTFDRKWAQIRIATAVTA